MRLRVCAALLVLVATPCFADRRLLISFRVEVPTHDFAVYENAAGHSYDTLIFASEPALSVTVSLTATTAPTIGSHGSMTVIEVPERRWWEALEWRLTRFHGKKIERIPFSPKHVEDISRNRLSESARFPLPALKPGRYRLAALINGNVSGSTFRVVHGDEDQEVRIALARYKARHSYTTEEQLRYSTQYAELDRFNPSAWMELGDMSLRDRPPEEIERCYENAAAAFREARKRFVSKTPNVVQQIDRWLEQLVKFRLLRDRYYAARDKQMIVITSTGPDTGRTYELRDRKSNRLIDSVSMPGTGGPAV